MDESIIILKEKLLQAGLKATSQRLIVYKAVDMMTSHPTVEQVYDHVLPFSPSLSLATVYKNLETLVQAGLIKKVWSEDGQKRFDSRLDNHAHIHCNNTREIVDYHDQELNNLILNYFKRKRVSNLMIKNISLHISGEKLDPDKPVHIK